MLHIRTWLFFYKKFYDHINHCTNIPIYTSFIILFSLKSTYGTGSETKNRGPLVEKDEKDEKNEYLTDSDDDDFKAVDDIVNGNNFCSFFK